MKIHRKIGEKVSMMPDKFAKGYVLTRQLRVVEISPFLLVTFKLKYMGMPIKIDYEKLFKEVLSLVKKGISIKDACLVLGYNSTSTLYRVITKEQKWELKSYKSLQVKTKGQGLGVGIKIE